MSRLDTPTMDFTFDVYERLLEAGLASGYEFLTVREYLMREGTPTKCVLVRHDVDRKPENALAMAELEAKQDVRSTYYVRTVAETFDPDIIAAIEELGHEVGYHYEDLDRASGDPYLAHERFAENLERVRSICDVDTVCMHGNPLTRYDNRDMWDEDPEFDRYDLLGEAYLSVDFSEVTYFSDTGRTWRDGVLKVKDEATDEHEKYLQIDTTEELIDLLRTERVARAYLLVHPNRWARTVPEFVAEAAKDRAINAGKRTLQFIR